MLSSHWLCSTVTTKCMDSETLACGETVVQMEGMVFSNGQSRHFNSDRSKTSSSSSRLLDCMLPAAGLLLDDAAVSHSLYCWFTCTFHRHMFKCSHNLTELFDWTTVIGRHPEGTFQRLLWQHFLKTDVWESNSMMMMMMKSPRELFCFFVTQFVFIWTKKKKKVSSIIDRSQRIRVQILCTNRGALMVWILILQCWSIIHLVEPDIFEGSENVHQNIWCIEYWWVDKQQVVEVFVISCSGTYVLKTGARIIKRSSQMWNMQQYYKSVTCRFIICFILRRRERKVPFSLVCIK